jgi:hypothetical protein
VTPRPGARLVDPGFPCEPGVIGVADRATGVPEKHRAPSKIRAIGLDAGGDRASGLRAFERRLERSGATRSHFSPSAG